jgi:hypothetical protein
MTHLILLNFSGSCSFLGADAKIGQLDLSGLGEEDVGSFDVAVHLLHGVEVGQALVGAEREHGLHRRQAPSTKTDLRPTDQSGPH